MHAVAQWIPKHTIQTIVSYRLTIAHSSCYAPTITGACNESGKKINQLTCTMNEFPINYYYFALFYAITSSTCHSTSSLTKHFGRRKAGDFSEMGVGFQ